MNDNAMTFEYLIRRCYNTGRYGKPCADADIYRSLQLSAIELADARVKNNSKALDKAIKEYNKELGKVTECTIKALATGITKFKSKLSEEDTAKLHNLINELADANMQTLEKVMLESEAVFVRNQIFPA